ncbi:MULTISPECIES: DNA repair protein RecN [Alteribacter]|uniref:DNA repair protein RecN n=1 Tax=Alteribacter keqinensis TaxID=2483800 RepID=A0A3M7TUQ3_9BACI|nr:MULTISPECIES: DNA repair protein RecN [Alteribacter]MBM7097273.1 DNA repair protein RecN [Alteribacter salitolerans]RNA68991.1 DNA repair protein RecN [Alteribacter keqinensis]
MLVELSIKNFAIIDHVTVPFEEGLTVLTGETGAGKSIIIDAIGLLIGGRGSVEFVRHGSKRAEIEGLFSVSSSHDINPLMQDLGIEVSEDDMVVLRREITSQGKSICRINGKLVTLASLRQIGQMLVDIHGQHEHQQLLQVDKHLFLLDRYAESKIKDAKEEYKTIYDRFTDTKKNYTKLSANEQQQAQRLDLIRYQLQEIENAGLIPNEDDELQAEKQKLGNSEQLYQRVHDSHQALYGENKGLEWVMVALNQMDDAKELDPELKNLQETIASCYYLLEESSFSLRDYVENIEFNPERLNEIEARLSEVNTLKRKYGESVNTILEYASKIEEEVETLENKDEHLQKWANELEALQKDLAVEAKHLTEIRKQQSVKLTKDIQKELKALYMEKTKFEVMFHEEKDKAFTKDGADYVEFMVATNQGEPLKPLVKVASGGEISRIILALKTILASHEGVTALIFDEVDTGVSGRVAQAIAEKIHHISTGSQVLCITHLPQVAAMADTHLFIAKGEKEGRVTTEVTPLAENEKVEEIGRMISGVEITELTRQHAEELLDQAEQTKKKQVS